MLVSCPVRYRAPRQNYHRRYPVSRLACNTHPVYKQRVRVTAAEGDIIERVREFANWTTIASTAQVERHFMAAPLVAASSDFFRAIERENVAAYRHDQAVIRGALETIVWGGDPGRRRVAALAAHMLMEVIDARVVLDVDRRVRVRFRLDGVLACCWLAVALVLDADRNLAKRLGQCGKPGCGKFNLTFAGRPRRHCPGHLNAARNATAAQRVARWRRRQRARQGRRS